MCQQPSPQSLDPAANRRRSGTTLFGPTRLKTSPQLKRRWPAAMKAGALSGAPSAPQSAFRLRMPQPAAAALRRRLHCAARQDAACSSSAADAMPGGSPAVSPGPKRFGLPARATLRAQAAAALMALIAWQACTMNATACHLFIYLDVLRVNVARSCPVCFLKASPPAGLCARCLRRAATCRRRGNGAPPLWRPQLVGRCQTSSDPAGAEGSARAAEPPRGRLASAQDELVRPRRRRKGADPLLVSPFACS